MATGFIFYRGPSMIDGKPIVGILTGLNTLSRNSKTGGMLQTWILRADMNPLDAVACGADVSICGDCPHRGVVVDGVNRERSCYVNVFQAPMNIYKAFQRGNYKHERGARAPAGSTVRLGAYGDPAAIPFDVWAELLCQTAHCTGYTHQWRRFAEFQAFCMASADNAAEALEAQAKGWRTFRVRTRDELMQAREVVCPASAEAGKRTTCAACLACGGHSSKAKADIVIEAHGSVGKINAFERSVAHVAV